jgi:hypothetical protein
LRGRNGVREIRLRKPKLAPALGHPIGDLREEPAVLGVRKALADALERFVCLARSLTHISALLYIALMRYRRSIAVGSYVALSFVWVYWILDRQLLFGSDVKAIVALTVIVFVHLAVGFAVNRWWAALLPLLPVLLAAPLGYPSSNRGEPLPVWLGLLFFVPADAGLILLGLLGRRLADRRKPVAA